MRSAIVRAAMRRGWVWPMLVAAELEADLRQLGGLARPGRARDDDDLVVADGARDLVPRLADGQLGRVGDLHRHSLLSYDAARAPVTRRPGRATRGPSVRRGPCEHRGSRLGRDLFAELGVAQGGEGASPRSRPGRGWRSSAPAPGSRPA